MPIAREEFEKVSKSLEEEITSFLNKHKEKAFTSDEIMGSTSFQANFDLPTTTKISTFVVANFVAVLHDLVREGKIERKVVNNRMYFTAPASYHY